MAMTTESGRRRRLGARGMEELLSRVESSFRRDFVDGAAPGSLLPSVNELVERYDVSFAVARKFYERLQVDGVVRGERRKGFFLADPKKFQPRRKPRSSVLIGLAGYIDYQEPMAPYCHSAQILQALERLANQHGWRLRFFNICPGRSLGDSVLLEMAKARLDVVFLAASDNWEADLTALRRLEVPLLTSEERRKDVTCLTYDNRQIGLAATEHLLEYGHRDIAFVKFLPHSEWMDGREDGFLDAMSKSGLEPAAAHVLEVAKDTSAEYRRCVRELRSRGATAVFCVNEKLAAELINAGLDVKETAVIGVDDLIEYRSYDISTIQKEYAPIAEAAFNALVDFFDNETPLPPLVSLKGVLLKRGSTWKAQNGKKPQERICDLQQRS